MLTHQRTFFFVLFVALLELSSIDVLARVGGVDGGGGIGVRCPSANGGTTLELLDLHEAKLSGLQIPHQPKNQQEAIDLVSTLVGTQQFFEWYDGLQATIESFKEYQFGPVFNQEYWLDSPNREGFGLRNKLVLPLMTGDVGQYQIRQGCTLEQLAYFDDVARTLTVANNFSELDWLNRAALFTHEYIYRQSRANGLETLGYEGPETSERTRNYIGRLFSTVGVNSISLAPNGSTGQVCGGGYYTFRAYPRPDGAEFVFTNLGKRKNLFRATAVFRGLNPADLADPKYRNAGTFADIIFSDDPNPSRLVVKLSKETDFDTVLQIYLEKDGDLKFVGSDSVGIIRCSEEDVRK